MCYSLRCSFLHDVSSDIKSRGNKEDYSYEFELAVNGADKNALLTQTNKNLKLIKTRTVGVIDKLCECICLSAEEYYREKDPILFKEHKINFIDFNSFKVK